MTGVFITLWVLAGFPLIGWIVTTAASVPLLKPLFPLFLVCGIGAMILGIISAIAYGARLDSLMEQRQREALQERAFNLPPRKEEVNDRRQVR